eukprot:scaffold13770_cov136-Isochrysis_galbana.AAC.3
MERLARSPQANSGAEGGIALLGKGVHNIERLVQSQPTAGRHTRSVLVSCGGGASLRRSSRRAVHPRLPAPSHLPSPRPSALRLKIPPPP